MQASNEFDSRRQALLTEETSTCLQPQCQRLLSNMSKQYMHSGIFYLVYIPIVIEQETSCFLGHEPCFSLYIVLLFSSLKVARGLLFGSIE